ncbi:MAG: hypothetical protein RSB00_00975 [Bacilli bacterium]
MNKYEKAKDNSINKEEVVVNRKKLNAFVNKNRRIYCILGICAGILFGSVTTNMINKNNEVNPNTQIVMAEEEMPSKEFFSITDKLHYSEYLSRYRDLVKSETYRTNDMQHYWYNNANIASCIIDDKEPDIAIYGVYKGMSAEANSNMDEVIRILSSLDENDEVLADNYSTFEEYLVAKGYADKNGKVDYDEYEKSLKTKVLNLVESEPVMEGKSHAK